MRRLPRYVLGGALGLAALGYVGVTGFLLYHEDSMVFGGADLGEGWPYLPPDTGSVPWDSVRVEAEDGVGVFLLESPLEASPEAPWVIYFHGNGQLLGDAESVARYELLRSVGLNVLAVEYRGYGVSRSSGAPSEEGVYADGRAAWTYLTERRGVAPGRILLFGMSLGSGVATQVAVQLHPAGLVTEGAFTTLPAVAQGVYPWLPVSLVMRNRFDNLGRAKTMPVPWLLFHSRDDEVVPFAHALSLAAAAPDVEMIELTGSHSGGLRASEGVARAALLGFTTRVVGSDPVAGMDDPG